MTLHQQFSVLLPTFNRGKLIVGAINSILNQSFRDFEIIIVDDGSTDNTFQIIEELFGNNPKVKYFYKDNGERGAARNYGIKKAKGSYLVFLDSDDKMYPNYLEFLYRAINRNPQLNFFACKYDFHDKMERRASSISSLKEGLYNYKLLLQGNVFACNFCLKKGPSIILFLEDRKYSSMEDWIFLLENLRGNKLLLINELGVSMLDHEGRSMENNKKVIGARVKAVEYLVQKKCFDKPELKTIIGYSYNFCAVHSYLDYNRVKSVFYLIKIIGYQGFKLRILLIALKYLVGRRVVENIPQRGFIKLKNSIYRDVIGG